jgi:hypothetical protein
MKREALGNFCSTLDSEHFIFSVKRLRPKKGERKGVKKKKELGQVFNLDFFATPWREKSKIAATL